MKKLILTTLVFFSVSACAGPKSMDARKNVFESNKNVPVVVKVLLSPKGIPVVDFDSVVVDDDQRVIWVGPDSMVIRFSGESPFKEGKFRTGSGVISQKATREIKWEKQEKTREFKYEIEIDEFILDPILIRRRGL